MINTNQGANKDQIHLDIPARSVYLHIAGTCVGALLERDLPSKDEVIIHNVSLAVHEACVNIIEHACSDVKGRISLVFTLFDDPHRFVVDIYDNGSRFTLPDIQQPNLGELQVNGYGLFLINSLMDKVTYDSGLNQNHWHLEKLLV